MVDDPDATLLSAAEIVADGFRVDWPSLRDRAPGLSADLESMQLFSDVGEAYREVRDLLGHSEHPA